MGNPTLYRGEEADWKGRQLIAYDNYEFAYDGKGRRISKNTITYTYDSSDRLIKSSNGLEFFYDVTGVAGFICGGNVYVYRKDVQGNVNAILDSTGTVVVQYTYDAWGNHTVSGSNVALGDLNPFRYRGYYYDVETGFYYLQTRYYDPEVGRFLNMDSIAYADPETINGLNLYAYCYNNPVMNVDPTGNSVEWWQWLIGTVVAVGSIVFAVATMGAGLAIAATVAGAV